MKMKSGEIPNGGFHNTRERTESDQLWPTQEQVDAYIQSLECQEFQKNIGIPMHAEKHRAGGRARGSFAFWRFFCGLITLAIGSFAWLLKIICEALK